MTGGCEIVVELSDLLDGLVQEFEAHLRDGRAHTFPWRRHDDRWGRWTHLRHGQASSNSASRCRSGLRRYGG